MNLPEGMYTVIFKRTITYLNFYKMSFFNDEYFYSFDVCEK
jgi:hypothetical protein